MTIYVAARSDAHLGTTHFGVSLPVSEGGLRQHSAAWYAPGSRLQCGAREIPQVGETYATVGVASGGSWGLECGVNEHALAVSWEAIATREPAEANSGLSGQDLVRLALERGRNAREALEVLAALVERFGHGSPAAPRETANDYRFLFADPGEAWCLECAGRRWAARRVTRRLPTAALPGPEIRDDWEIGAKGLETYARERHWCEGPKRLDFAAVYGDGAPEVPVPGAEDRPPTSIGRGDLETLLRETGGAAASLCAALPHDRRRPWPLWVSAGPAPVGVFLPVYLDALLPLETLPDEGGAFAALADGMGRHFELSQPRLREAWKGFEADLERERRIVEREVAALFAAGRDLEARERLGVWAATLWSSAAGRAAELASTLEL
jgi:hypothetical protein